MFHQFHEIKNWNCEKWRVYISFLKLKNQYNFSHLYENIVIFYANGLTLKFISCKNCPVF